MSENERSETATPQPNETTTPQLKQPPEATKERELSEEDLKQVAGGDGQRVEFEVVQGSKGLQAANTTAI